LNYRIPLPDADVKTNARAMNIAPLLAADQVLAWGRGFFFPLPKNHLVHVKLNPTLL
jgi:hypothetical protein